MFLQSLKCPSCGASYHPSRIQCEYCHSYVIMSNEKYVSFNNITFQSGEDHEKYTGIYVYGTLLGKGERPINLGAANFYKGIINVGGKLLLTNKTLSFSSHKFLQGKTDVMIPLQDICLAVVESNMLFSQTISVSTMGANYRFVVYHGKEWIAKILEAKNALGNNSVDSNQKQSDDYIEELQKLKQLLDQGIITQEEFDMKKRMLLNI